ncbi:hypothetical protein B0A75_11925 [Flavobacterium oncorhynchi]|uniref:DUF423 domain-containing protein n=1 Tax=Flavobacterium oncorhynchi TaxID=728056 RepID=A0A226I0I0_9FLAO|nr:hypothetical protein [Flavobacterium oncorhynchi]OXA99130.1 hypothetical protein B0A75_11925 [Flavobacterium oncorhynchi]
MINKRNVYWLFAGIINLFTALLHAISGQISLVNPLLGSNLIMQAKAEWIGVWHMITTILVATSYMLIKNGLDTKENKQTEFVKYIGYLYMIFSVPFIVTSIMYNLLAPQWILLLPIGLLACLGTKK